MTDAAQAVVWDAVYEPFGTAASITGSASLNLRFPGQYFLIESGLAYNWHRHYDSTIGRYTQPDPLGLQAMLSDGPSVYAYARQSPLMEVDPYGQQAAPYNPPPSKIPGGPWTWRPDLQNPRGGVYIDPNGNWSSWDPQGHWDCGAFGRSGRQRYDWRGNPITSEEAHNPPWWSPRWPPIPGLPPVLVNPCVIMPDICFQGEM
jgi:RHS repeat-associated protein